VDGEGDGGGGGAVGALFAEVGGGEGVDYDLEGKG